MNKETGEIKSERDLTDADKKSGKWIRLPNGVTYVPSKPLSKGELRREAYMLEVARKKREGVNV